MSKIAAIGLALAWAVTAMVALAESRLVHRAHRETRQALALVERWQDTALHAVEVAELWQHIYETGQGETQAVCISMRR